MSEYIIEVGSPITNTTIIEVVTPPVVAPGTGGGLDPAQYESRFHEVTPELIYRAEALIGTPIDSPAWRVQSIAITYGQTIGTTRRWANGNSGFVHAWSDHLTLSYLD